MLTNTNQGLAEEFSAFECYGVENEPFTSPDLEEVVKLYAEGSWDYSHPMDKSDLEWALMYADYSLGVRSKTDKLVGIGSVRLESERYIFGDLMVHPFYRNRGIGTYIVRMRVQYADKNKLNVYIPNLFDTNNLKPLYETLGFTAVKGGLARSYPSPTSEEANQP